jgi:phage tail-like protein
MTMLQASLVDQDRARHVRLDDRAGWRAAALVGLERSPGGTGLRLQSLPGGARPLVDEAGSFGGLSEPTGVAVGREGRIYIADHAQDWITCFDPCRGAFHVLPCIGGAGAGPRQLRQPRGIAIAHGRLFVVDEGNRRLQVFALEGLALLGIWGPIDDQGRLVPPTLTAPAAPDWRPGLAYPPTTWHPWDVVVDADCRAYVSDFANGLVHVFDAGGRWLRAWDGVCAGTGALSQPMHLALDRSGRLYVVQRDKDYVVVLDRAGACVGRATSPADLAPNFRPGPLATDSAGNLYVADTVTGRLYCYRCCDEPGTPVRFTGTHTGLRVVSGLAFDEQGRPLAVDAAGKVIQLDPAAALATAGRYDSQPLDSERAGCQWHRVVLQGDLPAGCSVRIETYSSEVDRTDDEIASLPVEAWATRQSWVETALREWDCLVLSPPGRFLWLRLGFYGTGSASPVVTAVKAEFPRRTSAEHLPAVYRATPGSTFLERFLAIFDTLFARVERTLDALPGYFDPCASPTSPRPDRDFLSWLASWLDVAFEGTWDEARRRDVLRCAVELYRWRGTSRGIRRAIQLIAGIDPHDVGADIVPGLLEDFELRRWWLLGGSGLGDQTTLWGKRIVDRLQIGEHSTIGEFKLTDVGDPLRDPFHVYAHKFTVFFPAARAREASTRRALERIVEASKPAHTQHRLELVEPRFLVGVQATLGLDAVLGNYPAGVIMGDTRLGYDAVIGELPPRPEVARLSLGIHSQLGRSVL